LAALSRVFQVSGSLKSKKEGGEEDEMSGNVKVMAEDKTDFSPN
jgi:hypothetical protein